MATAKSTGRPRARPAARTTTARAPRGGKGMDPALFAELLESVREGGRILREAGQVPDAAAIRDRLGLSQAKFAELLGISRRTLEGWEQGRREPEGPARVLLRVAALHPEALLATRRAS